MANEIKIMRSGSQPLFQPGELVELEMETGSFNDDDYYIVQVSGKGASASSFAGAVVAVTKDRVGIYVGHHCNTFTRNSFRRFSGTIEITQK